MFFTSVSALVERLLEAKRELRLTRELKRLDRIECLALDDIGYVQQERAEMEVLFLLLAQRYERKSVLITSNLVFSQWDQIFKDPMTTAAAIDRVVHHSVIVELNVPSYRAEAAKKRTQVKRSCLDGRVAVRVATVRKPVVAGDSSPDSVRSSWPAAIARRSSLISPSPRAPKGRAATSPEPSRTASRGARLSCLAMAPRRVPGASSDVSSAMAIAGISKKHSQSPTRMRSPCLRRVSAAMRRPFTKVPFTLS